MAKKALVAYKNWYLPWAAANGIEPQAPDAERFDILDIEEVGSSSNTIPTYLVVKVQYPSCSKCAYEGVKIMVFAKCTLKDAIRWKRIDPHFREQASAVDIHSAPPPIARFQPTPEGWQDAMAYANQKSEGERA
jgi:hypothetical protein